jgi:hypothetical protein
MTQVHPGGITAAVPLEVSQLATAQGLGAHRATFAPNKRWRLIISVGVLVLTFGLLTLGIGASSMSSADSPSPTAVWSTVAIVELVLIGLFLWPLLTSPVMSAKARARQFYVFENGLVHVGAKGTQAYRFDAVADVIAAVVSTTYNGISAGTNYKYQVRFGDGRVLKLNTFSTDMARFGPLLQTEIANAQLPRFWDALGAGHALGFSPFTISSSGIATASKPMVPWSQIRGVQVANGRVNVLQVGKRLPWAGAQTKNIPNLYTFLALAERLAGSA